ncbi:VIT domain-containing protein [Flavitalea flava]
MRYPLSFFFGTFLLIGISFSLHAQFPSIKVEGKESNLVYLQRLEVDVKINGTIASTTWTMTFKNTTGRILEGELNFPLAEGISVSRYALDINGRLREAVPVEKEKGTMVFENIERRRVDPGLLEKVDGNGFRTRIYPINPNGTRTVLIGYEEELSFGPGPAKALLYRLPLAFKKPLAEFKININVIRGSFKPVFEENIDDELCFDEWNKVYTAFREWKNFAANKSIVIRIPKTPESSEVMMQQTGNHYFYSLSVFPKAQKIKKKKIASSLVLWDVSLSGLSRNLDKELNLLDAYFSRLGEVDLTLVKFSNTVQAPQQFTVRDGSWDKLKEELKNTVYDGATQFGALDLKKYPGEECLLFSDGHSTFGSPDLQPGGKPVYAIVSSPVTDFPNLQNIVQMTGGELINLEKMEMADAAGQLAFQSLYFMGVKASDGLEENYPSLPIPVTGSISIAGISYHSVHDLVLQFGYGGKVIMEKTVKLDFSKQQVNTDLSHIWAQKKIEELDRRYEENKMELSQLGKRYGIITRNTSLIVLESIQDYITYQIEPPSELRAEYDRIMKQRGQMENQVRRSSVDHAESYLSELLNWWQTPYNKVVKKEIPEPTTIGNNPIPGQLNFQNDNTRGSADSLSGYIAPPAQQALEGRVSGISITPARAPGADKKIRIRGQSSFQGNQANSSQLDEVVVTGYSGARQKRTLTGSVATVRRSEIMNGTSPEQENDEKVETDFNYNKNKGNSRNNANSRNNRNNNNADGSGYFKSGKIEVNTAYLDELKRAGPRDRYSVYLKIRKKYIATPSFYFNTAGYFLDAAHSFADEKDRKAYAATGLRILSNIAELDIENYELGKMLGYKLKELGEAGAACAVFKKVLNWRPFEPQSYRDYGLALEDAGYYQQALDTLYLALVKNYDAGVSALYPGIEETILPEINSLITAKADKLQFGNIPKKLFANMPVDIRVVLNWNMNDTDIDLWVTDPAGEKCYYSHRNTEIGGRISNDFTRGLGPEQFMLKKAVKGKYKIEVNYYGDSQQKIAGPTTIMAEVFTGYGTKHQVRRIITMQMLKESNGTVLVGNFDF